MKDNLIKLICDDVLLRTLLFKDPMRCFNKHKGFFSSRFIINLMLAASARHIKVLVNVNK